MSLNWDLGEIENHDEVCFVGEGEEREMSAVTHMLIWMTMGTGLGKGWQLDEAFAPEMFARLKLIEKLGGPLLTKSGEAVPITFEMVRAHIGLKTNAGTKTRAEFVKQQVGQDMDRWVREAKTQLAESKTPA